MRIGEAFVKASKQDQAITRRKWMLGKEVKLCLYHGMDNLVREFVKGETKIGDMWGRQHILCAVDLMADDWETTDLTGYHNHHEFSDVSTEGNKKEE